SDPTAACPLPFALGPDPALRPVVATTYELGWQLRRTATGLSASADVYRTDVRDDIFFVAPTATTGYFQNIAATRRAGVETAIRWASRGGGASCKRTPANPPGSSKRRGVSAPGRPPGPRPQTRVT